MNISKEDGCPGCKRKIKNMIKFYGGILRVGEATVICPSCGINFTPLSAVAEILRLKRQEAEAAQKEQEDTDAKLDAGRGQESTPGPGEVESGGLLPEAVGLDIGDGGEPQGEMQRPCDGDAPGEGPDKAEQVSAGVREEVEDERNE